MNFDTLFGPTALPGTDRRTRRTANLANALTLTTQRVPDAIAVVHGNLRWSWREFDARVDALAVALQDRGIGAGSVVLTHSPNTADLLTVMYATWRAGAVWAPTNFRSDPNDVEYLARLCSPSIVICHVKYERHAAAVADRPIWVLAGTQSLTGVPPFGQAYVHQLIEGNINRRPVAHRPRADEHVWYFFTSGSTGKPKAAVLTHDQMQFVIANHLSDVIPGLTETDGTLVITPLSHGSGIFVTMHVARGARIVLSSEQRFAPAEAFALIEAEKLTTVFTVPTVLMRLVRDDSLARFDVSTLRYVIYSGAPIAGPDLQLAIDRLGAVLVQNYGLGEVTANITVLPRAAHDIDHLGDGVPPAGYARTGMQISIQDDNGREVPPGVLGEICVCGPAVFAGYLDNPAANAKAFRDGWFRTGDLGYLDECGMLYITGRDSDMYISGGSNIDPREVEEKLLKHPDIEQVGVVGVPDPEWGEVGYAVCVTRSASIVDTSQLMAWSRTNIPRYKVPRKFVLVDALPTSGYGKVTKHLLRELLKTMDQWPKPAL